MDRDVNPEIEENGRFRAGVSIYNFEEDPQGDRVADPADGHFPHRVKVDTGR